MSKMDIICGTSLKQSIPLTDSKTKLYLKLNNAHIPLIAFSHLNTPKETVDLTKLQFLNIDCKHIFKPMGLIQQRCGDEAATAYYQCELCQKIKTKS